MKLSRLALLGALAIAAPAAALAQANNAGFAVSQQNALTGTAATIASSTFRQLAWADCINPNSSYVWLQFFDTAGVPVLGNNVKFAIPLAPTSTGSASLQWLNVNFLTAIKVAAATTPNGGVAPATPLQCSFGWR